MGMYVCVCFVCARKTEGQRNKKKDRQRERETKRQTERKKFEMGLVMYGYGCVCTPTCKRERGSNLFDADAAHLSDWFFEVVLKEEGEAEPFY